MGSSFFNNIILYSAASRGFPWNGAIEKFDTYIHTLAILFVIEYPFLGIFCYMKTIGVFVFATKLFCDEIMI